MVCDPALFSRSLSVAAISNLSIYRDFVLSCSLITLFFFRTRSRTRMNGATQTFRRPSVATNPSHTREPLSATTPTGGVYPTHMSSTLSSVSRNGPSSDTRYSKEQLLDMYKAQRDTGILTKNVADYFVAEWNPHIENASMNGVWGKRDDHKDNSTGPEVCWDHGGEVEPLGLVDMTDDEKEVCYPV